MPFQKKSRKFSFVGAYLVFNKALVVSAVDMF